MTSIFFLLTVLTASIPADGSSWPVIIDFLEPVNRAAVTDGVMGGLSESWVQQDDGRNDQPRLRADRGMDGVAWMSRFETVEGEWQENGLPLGEFIPTYRGRWVHGASELRMDRMYQITVMLADETSGPFQLEIRDLRGVPRS